MDILKTKEETGDGGFTIEETRTTSREYQNIISAREFWFSFEGNEHFDEDGDGRTLASNLRHRLGVIGGDVF